MESPHAPDENIPLVPDRTALAGVVLCGGRSTRMGVDKASIRLDGATLLERALQRLDSVCKPVLIAPGGVPLTVAGHRSVADAAPESGPLGGLVAALRASPHRLIAVVAVDLPWIDPRLIGDHDVAVCETASGIEPLHAVYAISMLDAAEAALAGSDSSLRHLIARSRAFRIDERAWREAGISDRFSRNINTPEDLAEVSREPLR